MYRVIKTINGREYFYDQETYRESGRVKTRNIYIGPVEPRRKKGIQGFMRDLIKREKNEETQAEMQARVAREDKEYAQWDHINDLLTADTISLGAISEIAEAQAAPAAQTDVATESAPAGKGEPADHDGGGEAEGDAAGDGDAGER